MIPYHNPSTTTATGGGAPTSPILVQPPPPIHQPTTMLIVDATASAVVVVPPPHYCPMSSLPSSIATASLHMKSFVVSASGGCQNPVAAFVSFGLLLRIPLVVSSLSRFLQLCGYQRSREHFRSRQLGASGVQRYGHLRTFVLDLVSALLSRFLMFLSLAPLTCLFLFFVLVAHNNNNDMNKQQPGWPTDWAEISDVVPYHDNINNTCRDCSSSNSGVCVNHVQSPIRLSRSVTQKRDCIGACCVDLPTDRPS
jgi:hypothetical protein